MSAREQINSSKAVVTELKRALSVELCAIYAAAVCATILFSRIGLYVLLLNIFLLTLCFPACFSF